VEEIFGHIWFKCWFDIIFTIIFILFFYIKIVDPGPIFFIQKRVGLGKRNFNFIKFRTMKINGGEFHNHHAVNFINDNRKMTKLDDLDPRILPGGKTFRKTSLDEIPQFINILKGEMSLIGPRPCIPYEANEYLRWHSERFSVVPGLTGLWQVSGKNNLTFKEMICLDIIYENNISMFLDLKILLLTIPTVIKLAIE